MWKKSQLASVAIASLLIMAPNAGADVQTEEFDIESQDLGPALRAYGLAADRQVMFSDAVVSGKQSGTLNGYYSADQALDLLLAGTDTPYSVSPDGVVLVGISDSPQPSAVSTASTSSAAAPAPDASAQTTSGPDAAADETDAEELADEADASDLTESELRTETVYVSASRRNIPYQDSTLTASILSGELLDRSAPESLIDFANTLPSLSVVGSGRGDNRITIRGIAALDQTGGATVGTYVNEIPIGADLGSTPETATFDLESIEVLRGPQGTYFGQASMGGTIRIVTKKPDPSGFSSKYRVGVSSVDDGGTGFNLAGAVNIPIVEDKAAIRLVGSYDEIAGYIDNDNTGEDDANTNENTSLRASGLFEVTNNTTLEGTYIYEKAERGALDRLDENALPDYQFNAPLDEFADQELHIANATLTVAFPAFDLVSSTNYYDRSVDSLDDDGSTIGFTVQQDVSEESFVQELRLVSTHGGAWEWVVGAFYLDQSNSGTQTIRTLIPLGPVPFAPQPGDILQQFIGDSSITNTAVFADVTYAINDKLRVSVGGRYTDEEVTRNALGIPELNDSFNVFTPKFSVAYDVTDTFLAYGNISKGARAGGFNAFIADPFFGAGAGNPFLSFEPDTLWSYEIGAKTSWDDGRFILNGALYFTDWSDAQLRVNSGIFNIPATSNAGKVEVTGLEIEALARPTDNLDLGFSASFTEAEFAELDPANTLPVSVGDPVPYTFDQNLSAHAEYRFLFEPLDADMFVRGAANYVGDGFASPGMMLPIGDFTTADFSIGASLDQTRVSLFVNNAFEEEGILNRNPFGADVSIVRPRTFGVRLNGSF